MKSNRQKLNDLSPDDIRKLMRDKPLIVNGVVSGFLWRVDVGTYVPIMTKTFIDWTKIDRI